MARGERLQTAGLNFQGEEVLEGIAVVDRNEEIRAMMQEIARKVNEEIPSGYGFSVMVFKFDEGDEPGDEELHWVSSARRGDMVRAMQEFIRREGN